MAQEDDGADELLRVAEASRHEEWQVAADGVANFRALEIAEEQRDAANARAEVAFRHADEREAELVVVKQQFELALAELNQQRDAEVAQMLGEVKQQQQAEMAQVIAEFARQKEAEIAQLLSETRQQKEAELSQVQCQLAAELADLNQRRDAEIERAQNLICCLEGKLEEQSRCAHAELQAVTTKAELAIMNANQRCAAAESETCAARDAAAAAERALLQAQKDGSRSYVDKIECLEEKKRTAVEQEDFMLAEDLKIQIHDCRQKEAAAKTHECADEVGHLESAINLRDHVPDELVCPITFEVFKSPMVCADGHTYEQAAIVDWLKTNNTSPKTNEPLQPALMFPNHQLRQLVQTQFKQRHSSVEPPSIRTSKKAATAEQSAEQHQPDGSRVQSTAQPQIEASWQAAGRVKRDKRDSRDAPAVVRGGRPAQNGVRGGKDAEREGWRCRCGWHNRAQNMTCGGGNSHAGYGCGATRV